MENTRLFFDMIDRRCSKEGPNCMIFTSNLPPDKWRDFFREEDSLLCALDRTFDAATVYLMKGGKLSRTKLENLFKGALAISIGLELAVSLGL